MVWVKDQSGRTATASFTVASTAFCAYSAGQTWTYNYNGGIQTFTVPCAGTYKLEVWGAQGGDRGDEENDEAHVAGLGGYSTGTITLEKGDILYLVVGGSDGYNGGGASNTANGGGATHIAIGNTNRGELKNYELYKKEILLVAGGGGGAYSYGDSNAYGGSGGGTTGGNGSAYYGNLVAAGGTQTSGGNMSSDASWHASNGSFGQGGKSNYAGGGGGWYGGGGCNGAGGGGSGYIGGVTNGSMSTGVRTGNGYAIITLLSFN